MRLKGKLIVNEAIEPRHLTDASKQDVWRYKNHMFPVMVRDLLAGSGTSVEVTDQVFAAATVKRTDGSSTIKGVVTDSPNNKCELKDSLTNDRIGDTNDREVFSRVIKIDTVLTGTLGFVNGQTTVNGTGTLFLSELAVGHYIKLDSSGIVGKIQSIISDIELELESGYGGESGDGSASKVNLHLVFYVELADNNEQIHTMDGEKIDFLFPESFDMFSAPFNIFMVANAFAESLPGTGGGPVPPHDHDDRYYTESEIGNDTTPSGASLVGVDSTAIVGSSADNVQDLLAETIHKRRNEQLNVLAPNTLSPLTWTPRDPLTVIIVVEGVTQDYGALKNYVVTGKTVIWSGSEFALEPGDNVRAIYDSID